MRIEGSLFETLLKYTPSPPPEVGGLLGGQNGIISKMAMDSGIKGPDYYTPDVKLLNRIIEEWDKDGIELYGLFHTHFSESKSLSFGDREYIKIIMRSIYPYITTLYFPILIPQRGMLAFIAHGTETEVNILRDEILVI